MRPRRPGRVCSASPSGKATTEGNEEALQGGGGGNLPDPILKTRNGQAGRRTGRSMEARTLGSCHVDSSLASSLAGTCSPGGRSCASP